MHQLQGEHTSKAGLAQEEEGGQNQAPADTGLCNTVALPEEIEKICHQYLISDSTLTLPHIQRCLEDMIQEMGLLAADAPTSGVIPAHIRLWSTTPELGHPLIDDNHERLLHPVVGPFLREYLSRHKDMDDEDDKM